MLSSSARDCPGDALHRGGKDESILGHGSRRFVVAYGGGAAAVSGVAKRLGILLAQVGISLEGPGLLAILLWRPSGLCAHPGTFGWIEN